MELASWAESHNCAAICIQDHQIYFQDSQNKIKREPLGAGWEFIYSCATTEGNHGVGFVVSPQTASALEDMTCISDWILHLKLHGRKQKTYLYSAHAPTAVFLCNERESFSHLQSDIHSLPARDVVVIGLDANRTVLLELCRVIIIILY